jgi:hypothetical protein
VTTRVVLSVMEIVLVVAVLVWFLTRLTTLLEGVAEDLSSIDGGVRAIHGHCTSIDGPVSQVVADLEATARGLAGATVIAQGLGG